MVIVKATPVNRNGEEALYFASASDCCREFGIGQVRTVLQIIDTNGISPGGDWIFDYPTDFELALIKAGKIPLIGTGQTRTSLRAKREQIKGLCGTCRHLDTSSSAFFCLACSRMTDGVNACADYEAQEQE